MSAFPAFITGMGFMALIAAVAAGASALAVCGAIGIAAGFSLVLFSRPRRLPETGHGA